MFTIPTLYTMPHHDVRLLVVNTSMILFFTIAIIPVGFSFACELTYPVSEPLSNGILMLVSQFGGFVVTILANLIEAFDHTGNDVLYMFIIQMTIALIMTFFIEEDLQRTK